MNRRSFVRRLLSGLATLILPTKVVGGFTPRTEVTQLCNREMFEAWTPAPPLRTIWKFLYNENGMKYWQIVGMKDLQKGDEFFIEGEFLKGDGQETCFIAQDDAYPNLRRVGEPEVLGEEWNVRALPEGPLGVWQPELDDKCDFVGGSTNEIPQEPFYAEWEPKRSCPEGREAGLGNVAHEGNVNDDHRPRTT
jgi:hypothetical protein